MKGNLTYWLSTVKVIPGADTFYLAMMELNFTKNYNTYFNIVSILLGFFFFEDKGMWSTILSNAL